MAGSNFGIVSEQPSQKEAHKPKTNAQKAREKSRTEREKELLDHAMKTGRPTLLVCGAMERSLYNLGGTANLVKADTHQARQGAYLTQDGTVARVLNQHDVEVFETPKTEIKTETKPKLETIENELKAIEAELKEIKTKTEPELQAIQKALEVIEKQAELEWKSVEKTTNLDKNQFNKLSDDFRPRANLTFKQAVESATAKNEREIGLQAVEAKTKKARLLAQVSTPEQVKTILEHKKGRGITIEKVSSSHWAVPAEERTGEGVFRFQVRNSDNPSEIELKNRRQKLDNIYVTARSKGITDPNATTDSNGIIDPKSHQYDNRVTNSASLPKQSVEAFEFNNIVGVHWHPEAYDDRSQKEITLQNGNLLVTETDLEYNKELINYMAKKGDAYAAKVDMIKEFKNTKHYRVTDYDLFDASSSDESMKNYENSSSSDENSSLSDENMNSAGDYSSSDESMKSV